MPEEAELLDLAQRLARAAAAELMARHGRVRRLRSKSSPTDPVSEADLAAERAIRESLAAERPFDAILGEEGGATGGAAGGEEGRLRWVVDPLDGTVNYLYGYPAFGVSIACEDEHGSLAGVVLDPVRDECFAATRSGPATLNGEPLSAERPDSLDRALVATGFGYDPRVRGAQAEVVRRLIPRARDIRRGGSAALDLCYCAAGRLDAYYERGVKLWDYAAGALVCERAGLAVRTLPAGEDELLEPPGLLVAPPGMIDELAALVS